LSGASAQLEYASEHVTTQNTCNLGGYVGGLMSMLLATAEAWVNADCFNSAIAPADAFKRLIAAEHDLQSSVVPALDQYCKAGAQSKDLKAAAASIDDDVSQLQSLMP